MGRNKPEDKKFTYKFVLSLTEEDRTALIYLQAISENRDLKLSPTLASIARLCLMNGVNEMTKKISGRAIQGDKWAERNAKKNA